MARGIPIQGTLAVLVEAQRRGLLGTPFPEVLDALARDGFRIAPALRAWALTATTAPQGT